MKPKPDIIRSKTVGLAIVSDCFACVLVNLDKSSNNLFLNEQNDDFDEKKIP